MKCQTWKGIKAWAAARHIAKVIEKTSGQPRIGVMLPTSGATVASFAATWLLGRTVVPLNYLFAREELEYVIRHAELDAVVTATLRARSALPTEHQSPENPPDGATVTSSSVIRVSSDSGAVVVARKPSTGMIR